MIFYVACLLTSVPSGLLREKGATVVVNDRAPHHLPLCAAILLSLEYQDEESVEPTFEDEVTGEIMERSLAIAHDQTTTETRRH